MSGEVVGWAFKQDLTPTQKLVLLAIADNAQDDGKAFPGKKLIIDKTGLGKSSVYRSLEDLEERDLLRVEDDDDGRRCFFLSVPQWEKESRGGTAQSQSGKKNSQRGKPLIEEPSGETSVEPKHTGRPKSKVGGKLVTDAEYLLADSIVAAFNEAAGTSVTVDAHLTPIVGRIREKPDLTGSDHRGIIAAVFAVPWWTGGASPAVIYGNAAQFERSIETWRAAPAKLQVVGAAERGRMATKMEIRRLLRARALLRSSLPSSTYGLWIKRLRLVGVTADTVHVACDSANRAWAERRYSALMAQALADVGMPQRRVSFAALDLADDQERRAA